MPVDAQDGGTDEAMMARAVRLADTVRTRTSPNPWVGCVLRTTDGALHEGATAPPGGPHAEAAALAAAGPAASTAAAARRAGRVTGAARGVVATAT